MRSSIMGVVMVVAAKFGAVVDPDRGHSERLGRDQVLDHVVGQQRMGRVDPEPLAQQLHSRADRAWAGSLLAWMSWRSSNWSPTPSASSTRQA